MKIHYRDSEFCHECHGQPAELLLDHDDVDPDDRDVHELEADPEMVAQLVAARAEVERLEHAIWQPVREQEEEEELQWQAFEAMKLGPPTPPGLLLGEMREDRRYRGRLFLDALLAMPVPRTSGAPVKYVIDKSPSWHTHGSSPVKVASHWIPTND